MVASSISSNKTILSAPILPNLGITEASGISTRYFQVPFLYWKLRTILLLFLFALYIYDIN